MTGQETRLEAAHRKALEATRRNTAERAKNSPNGMRTTAQELRNRARAMRDCSDRDAILRLAVQYERRAQELERTTGRGLG
jgi:hypothetical protein